MSNIAIRVQNLSKQYKIGVKRHDRLKDLLASSLNGLFSRPPSSVPGPRSADTIWALKDVSFEVKEGEVLGIIGKNGAGKSTLLKILSRITAPTHGRAEIYGRVGSLLEVGTGFDRELTGRENIYLNGAILGMTKREIDRKFDEIVDFSGVVQFIDTPVKHYSSGMYVRLAFAVGAHLEPEILIVDEVLAVGDADFQKKCLGKMGNVAKEGRTVLFVSHNMVAMQSLCGRVIWVDDGRVVKEEPSAQVVSRYLQTAFSNSNLTEQFWPEQSTGPGNDKVRLRRASVRPVDGSPSDPITVRTAFQMQFEYWNLQPGAHLNLSLHIYNEQGVMVFNAVPTDEATWQGRPFPAGLFRDVCFIPGDLLNDGNYRVELLIVRDDTVVIYRHDDILVFDVQDSLDMRGAWYGRWSGAVRPRFKWRTELLELDQSPLALINSQS